MALTEKPGNFNALLEGVLSDFLSSVFLIILGYCAIQYSEAPTTDSPAFDLFIDAAGNIPTATRQAKVGLCPHKRLPPEATPFSNFQRFL